MTEALLSQRLA